MHYLMQHVEQYLMSCRELTAFCTQNGWIDRGSLYCEILEQNDREVILFVQFDEVLMDGSGCHPGRIPCEGRLRLTLDHYGQVNGIQLF